MLAVLFLLASVIFGFWLTYPTGAPLRLEERLAMGTALGLAVTTLFAFLVSLLTGVSEVSVAILGTLAGIAGGVGLLSRRWNPILLADWRDFRKRARTRGFWIGAVVFGIIAAGLLLIFNHAIFSYQGTIYAGFGNVWGDWNQHIAQTTSFASGDNLPPTLTTMSGQKLTYPFMTNFLSALLVKGGVPLLAAMRLPAMLLALSGLGMLLTFTRQIAGSRAAILAGPLFYLSGGIGFINAFSDWAKSHQSILHFLGHQPHNYTQTYGSDVIVSNIDFINPVFAEIVPQRAFLFGLPLVLIVLTLLYWAIRNRSRTTMVAAGLAGATLPFIHTHGLIFLGFLTLPLIWLTRRQVAVSRRRRLRLTDLRLWLWFLVPIILVALPQFLWLTAGIDGSKFLRFQFGWVKGEDSFIWFWLKNLGLFIPLLAAAFFVARQRTRRLDWREFALSSAVVFILANLIIFQPWDWDNSKLLVYWLLVSVPAVAWLLVTVANRGRIWAAGMALIFLSLTMAGTFDVTKTLAWQTAKVPMFDTKAQEIAQAVRLGTPKDAVFLTAQQPNNPISGLGGRRIVMGYTGWLWSYGIAYQSREADVASMYDATAFTPDLLKKYRVDYAVFGPAERGDKGYKANEPYYAERYAVWRQFGDITIYDVHVPR